MVRILTRLYLCFCCVFLARAAIDHHEVKKAPEYKNIDPKLEELLKSYKEEATKRGIKFTKPLTMGFKDIDDGNVVGLCTYGDDWREIDVDKKFWKKSNALTRKTLIYHELTHCLCTRGHDFGKDANYPEGVMAKILNDIPQHFRFYMLYDPPPGYYDDGCPYSIMHPVVIDNQCMKDHKKEYAEEMWQRCKPW